MINPVKTFSGFESRPELLRCHTVADDVVAIATGSEVQIWNMNGGEAVLRKCVGCFNF